VGPPVLGSPALAERVEHVKVKMLMTKRAAGTKTVYESAWNKWAAYRQRQGLEPMLLGNSFAQREQDEDDLCGYVVHLVHFLDKKEGTVKQHLFAIRYMHLVAGYPDPLLHRQRLWGILGGLAQMQSGVKRKYPATPRMLEWLYQYLTHDAGLDEADAAVVWAAVNIGFFYLPASFRVPSGTQAVVVG